MPKKTSEGIKREREMEVTEMEVTDHERGNKDAAGNFHSKCDYGEEQLDCGA